MFISETVGSMLLSAMRADEEAGIVMLIVSGISSLIGLAVAIVVIMGMWKVFVKAGQPGWAAIVPIYNVITLWKISGRPTWVLIICFVPCGGIPQLVAAVMMGTGVAEKFGKSQGFGIGLGLAGAIFYPLLGFSDATYNPNAGAGAMPGMPGGMPGGMNPYGGQAPGGYGQAPPAGGYGGPPQGAPPGGGGYGGPPPGGMPPGGGYGGPPPGGMPPGGGYGGPPGGGYPPR